MTIPYPNIGDYQKIIEASTMSKEELRRKLGIGEAYVKPPEPAPEPLFDPSKWFDSFPRRELLGPYIDPLRFERMKPEPAPRKVIGAWDGDASNAEALDYASDGYMSKVHRPEDLLETFQRIVGRYNEYDTIVGTGLSGTIAASMLATRLDKRYLIVRKPGDGSHSAWPVEGTIGKRWIFVDDMIASGATFARTWDAIETIKRNRNFETTFVGIALYTDYDFCAADSLRVENLLKRNSAFYV